MVNYDPHNNLQELREREQCCREVIEALTEKSRRETGRVWAHHLPRMVEKLSFFADLLQDEIHHFGEWRDHGFQPDEVIEFVDEDLTELVAWIYRLTGEKAPPQEQET